MGGTVSSPKGIAQPVEQPQYYLEAFVGPKGYDFASPFWKNLLSLPLNYPWPRHRVTAACAGLARNNATTGHVVKLLKHLVWSLQEESSTAPSVSSVPLKAINAAHFSRIFLQYFIEVFNGGIVDHLISDIDDNFARSEKTSHNVMNLVIRSLLSFIGSTEVNSRTYLLHLECVNLLLVMTSSHLHPGYVGGPMILHPFLVAAMSQEIDLVGPFVRKLLVSFVARLPIPPRSAISVDSREVSPAPTGILRRMTTAAANVLLLPYHSYAYLLDAKGEVSKSPLADNSLLLLLVLVEVNIRDASDKHLIGVDRGLADPLAKSTPNAVSNPFREALDSQRETGFYPILKNSTGTDTGDPDSGLQTGSSLKVVFGALYESLSTSIADERSTLLLYSLVNGNHAFLEYVIVRIDLDTLLLPILEVLYNVTRYNSNQIYMLLIILLIVSKDNSFNASVHKLILPGVPWYKERLLAETSLGSLMVVILIKVMKDLSKLRDVYAHTSCLATLSNMAPHCHHLNAYAGQCLVTLFDRLARKYTRLSDSQSNDNTRIHIAEDDGKGDQLGSPVEEAPTELQIYRGFLQIVLEIINCILTYALDRNPELVYALLHRQELLHPFREDPNFPELLANIYTVIEFFSVSLESNHVDGPWSVERVLEVVVGKARSWRGEGLQKFAPLQFTYEEDLHSQDFFTPYLWQLVVAHSGISWGFDLDANQSFDWSYDKNETYPAVDEDIVNPATPVAFERNRSFQKPFT